MNIVFMGTPEFAVPSLQGLIDNNYNILAVVTQPDRPRDRGKRVKFSPVKEFGLKNNIKVLQPEKIKDQMFIQELKALTPDLIVVIAYGRILPREILTMPKHGCINVHASLLPSYRGAAPINWAIISGEKKSGITTMLMDEGLDTGDMILKSEIEISDYMTAGELHDILADLGKETLLKTIENIKNGNIITEAQNHSKHSYAPMLDKRLGRINWNKPAKEIVNLVRGTNPWPGAYTFLMKEKIKIWKAKFYKECSVNSPPGTIIDYISSQGWLVNTGKGLVLIEEIQMPNKKRMAVHSFVKGNNVNMGTILGEDGCE